MGFIQIDHLQTSSNARHLCRNPRCRSKLKAPTDNLRRAFCCRGCHSQFYRTRCLVCEKELPPGRSDRRFCRRPSCRSQYRRNPILFNFDKPKTDRTTGPADLSLKSPIKSGTFGGLETDRTWRIVAGPELTPEQLRLAIGTDYDRQVLRENFRANAKHWNAAALIGPNDAPVNVVGGYKFPGAPNIDLYPAESPIRNRPTDLNPAAPNKYIDQIPADLSIPPSLRRVPA
jgi:hypothetical protein